MKNSQNSSIKKSNNLIRKQAKKDMKRYVSKEDDIQTANKVMFRSTAIQFSSVQLFSHVRFFVTPCTTARQASLSITNTQSPSKPMSIESVMPSNNLTLYRPLLLLSSIFPSIRVFSNESALLIRKLQSIGASASFLEYSGLISFRIDWFDLAVQGTPKSL